MGSSKQGSQATVEPVRSSGRGFAAVDPERQREIDEGASRAAVRREPWPPVRPHRPNPPDWFIAPRDAQDEGGSSRRGR